MGKAQTWSVGLSSMNCPSSVGRHRIHAGSSGSQASQREVSSSLEVILLNMHHIMDTLYSTPSKGLHSIRINESPHGGPYIMT